MSQQYVLLRKENDLLNSLIGQSFNQKSKFEAYKILTEIHSKAQDRSIGKMALCYIVDKNEVLGVGGSTLLKDKKGKIVSNLILDNFGILLAGLFKGGSGEKSVVIKDVGGINQTLFAVATVSIKFNQQNATKILLAVGSGSLAPARTDFKIQTAFGTAPESLSFDTGIPVYNSGLGNFKSLGSIIAGGSGTINESVLNPNWVNSGGAIKNFTIFRDIISPGQSFIAGQSITLEYTIQL